MLSAVENAFSRHANVAFEFSGGKDSAAALFLLRDYWDRMTVFWCSGDPLDELREYVEEIAIQLPRFVEVPGNLAETIRAYGLPSDVVTFDTSEVSRAMGVGGPVPLQDRGSCCFRSLMKPMHEAVIASGATLIIRGQKSADVLKGPFVSGDVVDGVEFLYPVEGWSDDDVFSFLETSEAGIPRYYTEGMAHSFDCAVCTAWMDEPRGAYLKEYYPERFDEYRQKLSIVAGAVQSAVNNLIEEVEACHGIT